MLDLHELVVRAQDLEPLPASVTRLAGLVANPDTSAPEIEEVISYDIGLTGRILRYANSAGLGTREEITTVRAAVVQLGLGRVLEVATASSVRAKLEQAIPEYDLGEGQLWRHSVTCALAAELLPTVAEKGVPNEAFTAALLHDVGKVVLCRFLDTETLEFLNRAKTDGGHSRLEAEVEILGVHHGEIGGLVGQHWNLTERITKGIQHHHTPTEGFDIVCDVTHVADCVVHYVEGGFENDPVKMEVDPDSLGRLGMHPDGLMELADKVRDRSEEVLRRYEG